MTGIFKFGVEAWCLLASVTAHILIVAAVLALPALAQPEVADEERVSVDVVTPEELQEIIQESRLQESAEPEPELDPSVLEPPPEPEMNVKNKTEDEVEERAEQALTNADRQETELNVKDEQSEETITTENPVATKQEQKKPDPVKPRPAPRNPAEIGPKSDAQPRQAARTEPLKQAIGKPIVIPRKRVAPEEDKVLVGDRKRETLCHQAAKSEVTKSRPELKPDVVISSAIVPSEAAANIIVANGAAFRSEGRWYNFKFRCEADPFEEKLIAFDFLVGPAFPEGEVVEVKVTPEN